MYNKNFHCVPKLSDCWLFCARKDPLWLESPGFSGKMWKYESKSRPARSSENTEYERPGHITQERSGWGREISMEISRTSMLGLLRKKYSLSWRQGEDRGILKRIQPAVCRMLTACVLGQHAIVTRQTWQVLVQPSWVWVITEHWANHACFPHFFNFSSSRKHQAS